jgi:hypothetical protein
VFLYYLPVMTNIFTLRDNSGNKKAAKTWQQETTMRVDVRPDTPSHRAQQKRRLDNEDEG